MIGVDLAPALTDLDAPIIFFPVRHHSPAAARSIRELVRTIRPAAILIEGPADFNEHMGELYLPHTLPIAIYSYARVRLTDSDGQSVELRRGAFYPFCVYSPEWQALQSAAELGIPARFIDMPWAKMINPDLNANRYADGPLQESPYMRVLCREVGVESLDDLWDTLFEIPDLTPIEYMQRAHWYCYALRATESHARPVDVAREAHMADQIRAAQNEFGGRLLVVTGGYHSSALYSHLFTFESEPGAAEGAGQNETNSGADQATAPTSQAMVLTHEVLDAGIALTPYTYERLDSLRGYESGMPNPGFYHRVWETLALQEGQAGEGPSAIHRAFLARIAIHMRELGQMVSAADLIAVESTARAIADLRGHRIPWRRDLIDGVVGALVKDELASGMRHPFLDAVYEVFRGDERGRLAAGTALPPLVVDIQRQLAEHKLLPEMRPRDVTLDLAQSTDQARSRVLHRVRQIGIQGYTLADSFDLDPDSDSAHETWVIRWQPEFESSCIEAAVYGATLEDAAQAHLREKISHVTQPTAALAVTWLLDAALMGLIDAADELFGLLADLIQRDADFFGVAGALLKLLYLYRFDAILGTARLAATGSVLREAFERALYLLETLGVVTGRDRDLVNGIRAIVETYERCTSILNVNKLDLTATFDRVARDNTQTPLLRGCATGALWTLGTAALVSQNLQYFGEPEKVGDYLTGLFALAREAVQRDPLLIQQIDSLICRYNDDDFLAALPALRLAFSVFVPREKYYLTQTLFTPGESPESLEPLTVSVEQAARALAFENALFKALEKYGLL